jgi:3-methyladenine DNA glycosylase/8-oxoguanine DNA glycosylase
MSILITNDLLKSTEKYVKLKKYSMFHQTISLIISQKISFKKSRSIRSKIFEKIYPDNEFTIENIKLIKGEIANFGIEKTQLDTINNILEIYKPDINDTKWIEDIKNIKGIGIWTIKCLKIMFDVDNDIFLSEDYWIRSRLSELYNVDYIFSIKECNEISKQWIGNRTIVSKFLWRIKPEGIIALKNKYTLTQEHFL